MKRLEVERFVGIEREEIWLRAWVFEAMMKWV